jgi:hypothetical protein
MAELAQPWIQSPGFLQDRARKVHAGLLALNETFDALVRGKRLSSTDPKYKQWKALLSAWGKWYGDTSGSTWWFNSADATLESYELALNNWTNWVRNAFPETKETLPAPLDTYPPGSLPKLPELESTALIVGGAVALGVVLFLTLRR